MKTTITLLFSVLASVSAKTFRGWRGFHETKLQNVFSTGNTTEFVIHGLLGETHCEECIFQALNTKSSSATRTRRHTRNTTRDSALYPSLQLIPFLVTATSPKLLISSAV